MRHTHLFISVLLVGRVTGTSAFAQGRGFGGGGNFGRHAT